VKKHTKNCCRYKKRTCSLRPKKKKKKKRASARQQQQLLSRATERSFFLSFLFFLPVKRQSNWRQFEEERTVDGNVLICLHFSRSSWGPPTIKRGCRQAAAPSPPPHAFFLCDAKKTTTHQHDGDPGKGRATATVPYFRAAARSTDPGNRKTEHRVENPNLPLLASLLPFASHLGTYLLTYYYHDAHFLVFPAFSWLSAFLKITSVCGFFFQKFSNFYYNFLITFLMLCHWLAA